MEFHYIPQWQGPLSGRSFEQQTEDAINQIWKVLDSSAEGYVLPQATSTILGGVFVDTGLDENSFNPVRNSVVTYALDQKATIEQLNASTENLRQWIEEVYDADLVHITGEETISGPKIFSQGPFGTTVALSGSEIDLSKGVVFTKTISADAILSITGVPSGVSATFNLILENGGSYTITWPSNVAWGDDAPPDLTPTGIDVLTFMTPDGGVHWYGVVALSGLPDSQG